MLVHRRRGTKFGLRLPAQDDASDVLVLDQLTSRKEIHHGRLFRLGRRARRQ